MEKIKVQIYNISNNDNPKYETNLSAGCDVRADFSRISYNNPLKIYGDGEIIFKGENYSKTLLRLEPGSRALIPTGLFLGIPDDYEIQVRPRSGLSLKKGLTCANCVGTIDADYKSEVGVIIINLGHETVWIEDGERICQFILKRVPQIEWESVNSLEELSGENRGGGFGHTGSN